MGINSELEVI